MGWDDLGGWFVDLFLELRDKGGVKVILVGMLF